MPDSAEYREKKAFFDRVLTVYGRKPVLEALQDEQLQCHTLHLADSNRDTGIIRDIRQLADARGLPVKQHTWQAGYSETLQLTITSSHCFDHRIRLSPVHLCPCTLVSSLFFFFCGCPGTGEGGAVPPVGSVRSQLSHLWVRHTTS